MIKLKSLLKENQNSKSWWMRIDGKLFRVPGQNHSPFASEYLIDLVQQDPSKLNTINMGDVYGSMYNMGWIRVVLYGYQGVNAIQFNLNSGKKPSSKQRDALLDIAKENGATEVIDATNGGVFLTSDLWE